MLFVFYQLISCADRIQLFKNASNLIKVQFDKQKAIKTVDQECLAICNQYESKLHIPSSYSGCSDVCADKTFTSCLYSSCSGDRFENEAEALACVDTCFKDDDKGLSTGAIIGIVIGVIVVVAVVVVVVVIVIRKKKASNKSSDEENRQESL